MPQTKTNIVFAVEKENLIESNSDNNVTSIDLMKLFGNFWLHNNTYWFIGNH